MKGYLFGLGAMLVGAGLMFVLMHGEVSAEGVEGWVCDRQNVIETRQDGKGYTPSFRPIWECKKGSVTCYRTFSSVLSPPSGVGLSCLNTGMFK